MEHMGQPGKWGHRITLWHLIEIERLNILIWKKVSINIRHFQQVDEDLAFSATIYALASRFGSGIWAETRLLNNQLNICFSLHIDIPGGGMLSNKHQSYM